MSSTLIITKYHLPPVTGERVPRLRLLNRLGEALLPGVRLALVSAPAGSGKTTLVRAWIGHLGLAGIPAGARPLGTAWLSLDQEDNDPAVFMAYLSAALKTACPEMLLEPFAPPSAGSPSPLPALRPALAALVNQLAELPGLTILVLDDYHVISTPSVHECVAFLLEHLPERVRLVIVTRADSLLPLSRLRACGQVLEVRQADLRFTQTETAEFLIQHMGLQISQPQVELLAERTEGWAAGLQMAALALRSLPETDGSHSLKTDAFVRAFSGSHRYVLDYLMDEVISSLPENTQHFLLQTAILDRFCVEACAQVLGPGWLTCQPGSIESLLRDLNNANLFLIPLDEERSWYRYHHLFLELLRSRLRQVIPAQEIAELQRRASAWFAGRGLSDEAIHYALQGGDFEPAAGLIEQCAQEVISNGRLATLSQWLERLPAAVLAGHPRLRIFQALISFMQGDQATAVKILVETSQALEKLPDTDSIQVLKRELLSILAMSSMTGGDSAKVMALVQPALDAMPETELIPRARLLFAQALASALSSEKQYYSLIKQAMELARQAGDLYLAANILNIQAMGAIFFQARYHTAWSLYDEIISMCASAAGERMPLPGSLGTIGQAGIAMEWNELDRAAELLEKGVQAGRQGGLDGPSFSALLVRARLAQAHGDLQAARSALDEATYTRTFDDNISAVAQLAQAQVRLNLAAGQLEAAEASASGEGLPPASRPSPALPTLVQEVWSLLQARVLLAQDRPIPALAILERLIPQAESTGRLARVIEGSLVQAMAFQALQRDALEPLQHALSLSTPQGMTRLYLEAGLPVRKLLLDYRPRLGEFSVEAGRLLQHMEELAVGELPAANGLVEQLTRRELDVLRLLCAGQSNQEIAATLFLSLSAVKKYTGNLYGKLGVTSRAQAIVKAHELHLA